MTVEPEGAPVAVVSAQVVRLSNAGLPKGERPPQPPVVVELQVDRVRVKVLVRKGRVMYAPLRGGAGVSFAEPTLTVAVVMTALNAAAEVLR